VLHVTATADHLSIWVEERRNIVERALGQFLPATPRVPHIVAESMRYSLFAGGKRLRPMLALAAAEACGERCGLSPEEADSVALPAACALEMIHTYSLVHDDLPAMDNDTLRRGKPTAHVVYGEGFAILSGDALLTEAFSLLAREPASSDLRSRELDARKLRVIQVIAQAAGAAGMVGGQAVDLEATAAGAAPLDDDELRSMHARKTGALIRASALAGAIMAGADDPLLNSVATYGANIGLAFQIVDDILDVEGASAKLGKTAGKDAAAGKPTYPAVYGVEESRRLSIESADRAVAALAQAGIGGQLTAIARWVVSRTH
jgi:geranylgeranyl diphosphate synthase, type II